MRRIASMAQGYQICHCEERSDVGISCRQLRFRRWLSLNSAGYCEIAPQGHFLALRAQGATSACGLLAMTNLEALRHRRNTAHAAILHGAHSP